MERFRLRNAPPRPLVILSAAKDLARLRRPAPSGSDADDGNSYTARFSDEQTSWAVTKQYWVYILTNHARTLYTGVTNDLARRVAEHRAGRGGAFTARYRIDRLVHFEEFGDVRDAIQREKQIKGWTREKKVRLVEAQNAGWIDLAPPRLETLDETPRSPPRDPSLRSG